MEKIETSFEAFLARLKNTGKVKEFTDEENLEISNELNQGMEVFLYEQKRKEKESELELAGVILNA